MSLEQRVETEPRVRAVHLEDLEVSEPPEPPEEPARLVRLEVTAPAVQRAFRVSAEEREALVARA